MRFTRHNDSHARNDFWNRGERDRRNAGSDQTTTAPASDDPTAPSTTPSTSDLAAPDAGAAPETAADATVGSPSSPSTAEAETGVTTGAPVLSDVEAAALLTGTDAAVSEAATLTRHDGTLYANSGDVIENLDIYADGVGIELEDDDNVTIRNVRIHYNGASEGGFGIDAVDADGLTIEGVELINAGAPESGPTSEGEELGIGLYNSPGAQVSRATVHDASTGIYLQDSPNAVLEGIEGYNMRGPFPGGQLVQFNRSGDSSLDTFYVYNDLETSWTEDNIHVGEGSDGVTITNGLIDGNNSPSGVGVMLEGAQNTTVRNVDTVHMGNGAFTDIGSNNLFDDVRSFDNFAESQAGRGTPMSGSLIFGLADDTTLINGAYQNPAQPENIVYGGGIQDEAFGGTFEASEITGQAPMAAYHNTFSWS